MYLVRILLTSITLYLACRAVRTRLQDATTWLLKVEEMCQPKATLAPAPTPALVTHSDMDLMQEGGAAEAAMHATAADNTSGVRRKTKEKDKDKFSSIDEGKGRHKGRTISPTPLPTQAPSMKGALLSLLLKGKDLGIEVDRELAIIVDTLAAIDKWDTQTSSALLSLDALQLEPLVAQYRALLDTVVPKIKGEVEARNGYGDGLSETPSAWTPPAGRGYIESSPFSCTDGFSITLDAASSSSSPSPSLIVHVSGAEGVMREEGLWRSLLRFDADIQQLANQAAELGIRPGELGRGEGGGALASAAFMQLLLCQATIQWMGEARRLLYFPSSPSGAHLPTPVPSIAATSNRDPVSVSVSAPDSDALGEKKKYQRKPKSDPQCTVNSIAAAAALPDAVQGSSQPTPSHSLCWGDCSRYALC